MANVSRPAGFRPVGHLSGAPYNGQANIYYVSSAADEILAGDAVKIGGSADANGIPSVDLAAAGDIPLGIVVGVMHSKFNPNGDLTTGSTALDIPAASQIAASGSGYVLVADSHDLICEVETSNGTLTVTDVGLNASAANGARTAATVRSPATLDVGTKNTTSTLVWNIKGFVRRPDNEVGAASAKILVGFNVHQFKSVGVAGA